MARKDSGVYHNFRLSRTTPEHIRINNFLENLNKEYYKSKNQFIAEALLYYIDALENGKIFDEESNSEWNKIKEDALKELVPFVESKVMYMLGHFASGMGNLNSRITEEIDETDQDDFIPDEELAGVSNMFVD